MPELYLDKINWLAVVVSTIATIFLGGAWYAGAFAKLWQRLHAYSDEKIKQMQAARPPHIFFGAMALAYGVLAIVMAVVFEWLGVHGWTKGAIAGALLWAGPAFAIGVSSWVAYDKRFACYALDMAYQLCFLVMMGAIIGGWR